MDRMFGGIDCHQRSMPLLVNGGAWDVGAATASGGAMRDVSGYWKHGCKNGMGRIDQRQQKEKYEATGIQQRTP